MELCEHLESVSRRALDSVKKKYISFELSDGELYFITTCVLCHVSALFMTGFLLMLAADIPMYLKDIKWKLDQKRKLVNTGANQIQVGYQ